MVQRGRSFSIEFKNVRACAARIAAAAVLAASLAAPVQAVTAVDSDADRAGRDDYKSPLSIGPEATRIEGRGAQHDQDHFLLSGVPAGPQTLTLIFEGPEEVDWSYSAGGQVLWLDRPFEWSAWDGRRAGGFQLDKRGGALAEVIVDLGESFQGGLVHLALHFTHGRDIAYSAVLPWAETAAPSPDRSAVIATP
ncbi:MAG: hypothetical protein AAF676_11885, partial [Pseudomonadota bacterium]